MAANRTERLLNLVICLLATRQFASRERIREVIPQYAACESDEAFERMFERDKDDLRAMGIPIVTGSNDAYFDDEIGYRIPREQYALPDINFEPHELAVLGVAAQAWQQASLAEAASQAMRKLQATGVDVDRENLAVIEPRVTAAEPAFKALYEAVRDRRAVAFDYRRGDDTTPHTRQLQPWGVMSWRGRWYVVGNDTDRDDTRVFRLSRIAGSVQFTTEPGTVSVPPDLDLRREVRVRTNADDSYDAVVEVRRNTAYPLQRRSTTSTEVRDGWLRVAVGFSDAETLAAELCGYAADVVVIAPDELRDAVTRRLSAVLTHAGQAP